MIQILKWRLPTGTCPTDGLIVNQLPMSRSDEGDSGVGGTRVVPPEEIPPMDALERLVATARRLQGDRVATMVYILAFGGLRIGECLALRNDDRFQLRDDALDSRPTASGMAHTFATPTASEVWGSPMSRTP